jgi:[calcium/calmodulin-dependent protein kinase] kinase
VEWNAGTWWSGANGPQETFNARSEYSNSEDDGTAQHRINQYLVKQEIGRGSFGAVHLAVDQYGQEYVRIPAY